VHRTLACAIVLALLFSSANAAPEVSRARPLKSTTGAVFRSLAVPGWGQFYDESYWRSAALLISESVLMINTSRNHDWMMAAKKAGNFENEQFYRNSRNKLIWWLAAVKLLSLGDAYVGAHLYKLDISPDLTLDGAAGPQIRATIHF